jgi:hypothetical protein
MPRGFQSRAAKESSTPIALAGFPGMLHYSTRRAAVPGKEDLTLWTGEPFSLPAERVLWGET